MHMYTVTTVMHY